MIVESFRRPGVAKARFVRKSIYGDFVWCEQNAKDERFDIAQGRCDAEDLPAEIIEKCEKHYAAGQCFYACEWPM